MPDVSLCAWLVFLVPLLRTPKLILECQQRLCRMTALVMGQALSQAGQQAQVTKARPAITQEEHVHSGTWKSSPRGRDLLPASGKGGLTGTVMGSFLIAHPRGTNWERYRDASKGSSDGNQKQDLRSQCLHFPEKL